MSNLELSLLVIFLKFLLIIEFRSENFQFSFFLFGRPFFKNKSKFCYKDEDGFEKCIEAQERERYYKYLPNKKKNTFQEKAEIVKKMSEKEKIKCRKWEAVKKEFDSKALKKNPRRISEIIKYTSFKLCFVSFFK